MSKVKEYNAFISYRHSELDTEVAKGLQKELEHFRLPNNLRKMFPKEKWKIDRIFRDQDELPIAEDLSEQIMDAIANSEFLIVICTPRITQSPWCAKEIELFKQMHGQDHILAVLAEGEPEESFPEGICYRDRISQDENGNEIRQREKIDPLAADVRGETKAKRKRRIKEESIRLAAALFGMPYDDVKQRHREQKLKKIAAISGICAGVFFIFGVICMGLMMKINSQKDYIEEQHEELQEQYREEQLKYAESMSMVSEKLWKEGRKKDAVYAIRSAMPMTLEEETLPYTASAEYALSKALAVYEREGFYPYEITDVPLNPDFWGDPGKYRVLAEYLDDQTILYAQEEDDGRVMLITNKSRIYYYDEDGSTLLDYTHTLFSEEPGEYLNAAAIKEDKLYLWFFDADYVAVYEWRHPNDQEILDTVDRNAMNANRGTYQETGEAFLSDDGKYKVEVKANQTVAISDAQSGEIKKTLYEMGEPLYKMEKLGERDEYVLMASGRNSYMLNSDLDIIARIRYYYGYDDNGESLILYTLKNNKFDLYKVSVLDYEDLIEEADRLLDGYESSDEIKERYKMLK